MRDAFGGVFMIRLMLVFIFIFVAFTAISLNYAKAFKTKNYVIDVIEQQEVFSLDDFFDENTMDRETLYGRYKLDELIASSEYHKECKNGNGKINREPGEPSAYCYKGVVIEEKEMIGKTIVYNVYTYAGWDLRSLNLLLSLGGLSPNSENVIGGSWTITGEARVVKREYK